MTPEQQRLIVATAAIYEAGFTEVKPAVEDEGTIDGLLVATAPDGSIHMFDVIDADTVEPDDLTDDPLIAPR